MAVIMERRMPNPLPFRLINAAPVVVILPLLTFSSACSPTAGDRNGLLEGVLLPALDDPEAVGSLPENGPSLDGFDRTDWPRVTVRIPAASVEAHPTWATPITPPALGSAAVSAFPSPLTALDIESNSGEELANAALTPTMTAIDIAISPVRMIMQPPWTVSPEPTGGFALLPAAETPSSENPGHD